jgi:hypothetical protein
LQISSPGGLISEELFRIAQREEQEWRTSQAEEIRAMYFRSPLPESMSKEIVHIQSSKVIEVPDSDEDLDDLEVAAMGLEAALHHMGEAQGSPQFEPKQKQEKADCRPIMGSVPTTHEAVFWPIEQKPKCAMGVDHEIINGG